MKSACIYVIFFALQMLFPGPAFAQQKTKVHIRITEAGSEKTTPAMVCITNIKTGAVHLPPDGEIAGLPTYPDTFFTGIAFTKNKNFVGPLRKMSGPGAVNGQRTYVYNPNKSLPYWHEPVQYQTSGDFTISLPPGAWRIAVQHGNEFIPVTQNFSTAAAQKNIAKTIILKRWINLPQRGWWSGDVHTHHPLYKKEFQEYMLQLAAAEDVHLLNVLQMGDRQHTYFTPAGFGTAAQTGTGNYRLATGQEEPRSDYGHVIGLNGDALARNTAQYNHYDLVFGKLRQKEEALVGFAHFAYGGEGVREGLALYAPTGAIDFVELLQNTKMDTAAYYAYLNLGFKIAAAAGSDFPWGSTVGDGRTFVYTGEKFAAGAWFDGLKKGRSFVSNGPALFLEIDGGLPGTTLLKQKNDSIAITVKAVSNNRIGIIDKVLLYNSDGLLYEANNAKGKDSVAIKMLHRLAKSQWITASVFCKNGALAHTSPMYIEVDHASTYNCEKGPVIIQKLVALLEAKQAVEAAKETVDAGLLQRIDAAVKYYQNLPAKSNK